MNTPSASIWVAHPERPDLQVDVAPVFSTLGTFDAPADAPFASGATDVIRRTIRTLNLSEHNPALIPPGTLVDLYQDLHRLEDMFEAIHDQQPAA
ncbi:hypothetical protein G8759_25295 [Spirosoma aureum]|uniref:Uncharacterized protein n=1 Tax=Spirosoma aureum TaxID=2692134 RepID=A0A6G9AT95_9BACT|nr:hypothetical protein [Spirosoma aureum]QIP15712.1 hypothetical protein G8759_25295 [Spirosoma aureum]